jgi:hypothetical protein
MFVQTQGVGQNRGSWLGHDEPIVRLDRPPNKRLRPTAFGVIMGHRG